MCLSFHDGKFAYLHNVCLHVTNLRDSKVGLPLWLICCITLTYNLKGTFKIFYFSFGDSIIFKPQGLTYSEYILLRIL